MNQTIMIDGGVQIPRLKKKEEERKGGGAPLPWMTRTTGLSLAAKEAPKGAFSSLLWGLNGRGGLAQLFVVTFGQRLSSAEGMAILVGALGMAALLLMGFSAWINNGLDSSAPTTRWGGEVANFNSASSPDPIPMVRPQPGELIADKALLSEAANETPDQDRLAPAEPAEEPAPAAPAVPEVAEDSITEVKFPLERPVLAGKLSMGSGGASFAGGASMGGGPRDLRDALAGSAAPRAAFMQQGAGPTLGGTAFRPRQMVSRLNKGLNVANGRSTRAMGQLKMANDRSFAALGSSGDTSARTFATDAFEQTASRGLGTPISGGGMSDGTPGILGSGSPDLTQPSVGPGMNVTPYQDKVDDAKKGIDKAMMMKLLGLALMAMGAIMLMIGKAMMANPATLAVGKALMKIGMALIVAGILAMVMAGKAKDDAQKKAKKVGEESGQKEQGAVINDCADQAVMPQRCIAKPIDIPTNDVQGAVAAERNATYDINNGGPIGAGAIR